MNFLTSESGYYSFVLTQYYNRGLAIIAHKYTEREPGVFMLDSSKVLTVNITDNRELPKEMVYLDNEAFTEVEDFVVKNKIGTFTGFIKRQNFHEYPLYQMELQKILVYTLDDEEMVVKFFISEYDKPNSSFFIETHVADEGFDYTIYDSSYKVIDGGIIEDDNKAALEVIEDVATDYLLNNFNYSKQDVSYIIQNQMGIIPDKDSFDELVYEITAAERQSA